MKYFEVHREELRGSLMSGEIYADGEYINEADELKNMAITTGFSVDEYDENGEHIGTEFYPVSTDMNDWSDNAEEQIENIKRDYPADIWQNNAW